MNSPEMFEGKHKGSSVLIIGTGHSTKNLMPYKDKLRNKFDVIIGLNFSTRDFEDELDYHMVLEKNPVKIYEAMKKTSYRKDLPRVINKKGSERWPKDINAIHATRSNFDGKPNILKYKYNGTEGFLMGPPGHKGLSVGSVALNGMHFAAMIGAKNIYLIGADLMFKDEFDHYYPDSHYRKSTTKLANRSPIITIKHEGKEYKTTKFFQESADFIDKMISTRFTEAGIAVYDFSHGLIRKAVDLDLDDFMRSKV